ncbi:EF-hand [Artomyces pyxidatus]|uniref:EF-hand n=1 Tax=Artomyces pyxidatus TaxID=48021 RepID=A0ACB8SZS6_9AGAM|nr:EF-hand [Artomyces pyxidatus]
MSYGYGGQPGYGGGPSGYGPSGDGPSGYGPSGVAPPPADADPQLWSWFTAVDTDRSGQITAAELQRALINGDWTSLDFDTVKMFMNIFDRDGRGTIGFDEFARLWKYIKDWQSVFRRFDTDRSGNIESSELSAALRQFGYVLSLEFVRLLVRKFASAPYTKVRTGPPPGITFDRFVRVCILVKEFSESFQKLDTNRTGWIQINYDGLLRMLLTLP